MDVNQMVKNWDELIEIADNTIGSRPEEGYIIRRQFAIVTSLSDGNGIITPIDIVSSMEVITEQIKEGRDQVFLASGLYVLSVLLATHFPSTAGLAARGYECAVKTIRAENMICPN